jgi:hypothetical protein
MESAAELPVFVHVGLQKKIGVSVFENQGQVPYICQIGLGKKVRG